MGSTLSTDRQWQVGLRLSTNLSRDPASRKWHQNGRASSSDAAISACAFLDGNRNKRRDSEEPLLHNVGFIVNDRGTDEIYGEYGFAFHSQQPSYSYTSIGISPATLEELTWIPAQKNITIVPRPGYPVRALLAV